MTEFKDEFTLEMGYTREEFIRSFSSLADGQPYQSSQDRIHLNEAKRQLLIKLGEDQNRQIASLIIPKIQVTFLFSGYSKEEKSYFMKKFRRYYHKGGG